MGSERKLTVQEHANLVEQAKSLSESVRQRELWYDEAVPQTLAKLRKGPSYTVESKGTNWLLSKITSLERISFKLGCLSGKECQDIPRYMRDIRSMLVIHYNFMQGIWPNIKDIWVLTPEEYADLATRLYVVGTFLRLHPTRLFTIMRRSNEDMTFVMFKETMCLSDPHAESAEEIRLHHSSRNCSCGCEGTKPTDPQLLAYCHRAPVKYLLLVSQLWMCVAQESSNKTHRQLAWKHIVDFSTQNIEIRAFADAMSYVLHPDVLRLSLNTFLMNNGIQALVCSWIATQYPKSRDNDSGRILEHIDLDIWECQSKDSIQRIMDMLVIKMESFSPPDDVDVKLGVARNIDDFSPTPLFQQILHTIYSVFGLDPFQHAAQRARASVLFPFLVCRIGRDPERYLNREQFGILVEKCRRLTTGVIDRYIWVRCEYAAREYILHRCSCDSARCPNKRRYRLQFQSKRKLNDADQQELDDWGMKMKLCAGCRMVMYCCKTCQREGWPWHKTYCLKGQEYHSLHPPLKEIVPL